MSAAAKWAAEEGYPDACELDRNGECRMCGRTCDEDMRRDCMQRTIAEDFASYTNSAKCSESEQAAEAPQ